MYIHTATGNKLMRIPLIMVGIVTLIAIGAISAAIIFLQSTPRSTNGNINNNITVANISPSTNNNNTTQVAALSKKPINVISTMSAFPFVQRWVAQYNNNDQALATVQISYLDDINAKTDRGEDLAIVGHVFNNYNSSSYYIPVSAQAVAIVYNIPSFPDVPSGLKLNASLLSSIFNGTITEWDDEAIKNLNHGQNLPHEKIVVVHENTNSNGSLDLLKKYISPNSINWPDNGSIATTGPDDLAAMVRKTPYSIGYVDFSYAVQTKMTFAAIANMHSGRYITPSVDSIDQAVNTALKIQNVSSDITQGATTTLQVINSSNLGNSSYPIIGLYYATVIPNKSASDSETNGTLDFVKWIIDTGRGQQALTEVQYPPIYSNATLMAYAQATIAKASESSRNSNMV